MMRSPGIHARLLAVGLGLLPPALLVGCPSADREVEVLPNQAVAALSADDVVRVMRRAGFSGQEILELGTDLRNGLATMGAVQVRMGQKVEAIFAVDGTYLHGTSRRRGSFIYDLKTKRFR